MVDIRKVDLNLPWLEFKLWSIMNLPFNDDSIESISAVCVVEHIWLWRYWDPIDSFWSEKSIQEIKRVLQKWWHFVFSVPVDAQNTVYFNAHRAFTRNYVLELLTWFELKEERYIYGKNFVSNYAPENWVWIWCYYFVKN